ncbi:P-type conjugative transfer protein TrbG [Asticcacaulis sp. BYS171W]|uniref:P-type conjugative transfer protein TrbG n=1 Tax=Asticcacaulis aquaticus TaxID=2984212 RepID=A0ABT5HQA8_9CAUL|nr:P-type conjugative transfer protein TrbG [Asticcacaulis aquaticus]MDC7682133.1 P-type conjugative transfer protein TrbG [Asticcacaulis aquaticus]
MKPQVLWGLAPLSLLASVAVATPAPKPPVKYTVAPSEASARVEKLPPAGRVEAANRAAAREPATENYLNAIQTYAYMEGALYRVYSAPDRVTDLMLEPGETVMAISAGDTARWIIGDTKSGEGAGVRTHILIKPHTSGLKTNLVVLTTSRTYHLQLESTPSTYMAAVSWRYPALPVVKIEPTPKVEPLKPTEPSLDVTKLNFHYVIEGAVPAWRPRQVFDDGAKTYIVFPAETATSAAPPLFLIGPNGEAQIVNYRVQAGYYVLDRLIDVAELRLGTAPQTVVRLRRAEATGSAIKGKGVRHD